MSHTDLEEVIKSRTETRLDRIVAKITSQSTWQTIIEDINGDVLLSGKPLDTIAAMNRVRKTMIFAGVIFFPLSLFLFFEFSPVFIGLNLIWIMIFAYPKIQLANLAQERKKKVEEEISSFVIFASVMQNVGVGLYESFQLLKETGLFKAMSKEALLLKRNVEYFGLSQMEALEELGRTHKSDHFRNLLLGYTSIWRSGGDLSQYLEDRAEEFFTHLKEKYQTYSNNVGTITEVLVTLLLILPIMIMVVSFVLPGSSLEQVTILATVGLPFFSILISVVISSIQPTTFNEVGIDQKILAALAGIGLAVGIGSYLSTNELWLAINLAIIVPSTISGIIAGRHYNDITKSEQSLSQFLRDMTEYKKIGYDVVLAIIKLSKDNLYNSVFNKKLGELGILLEGGTSPTISVKEIQFRSWFTKTSFYLLAYIAEYGGGNPKTLETINRFISNAKQVVKEGKSSISALSIIIFAAPIIMAFTAGMITNILGSFDPSTFESTNIAGISSSGSNFSIGSNFIRLVTVTPEFTSMIKMLIVSSSILGGFVITKAIDFTYYSTWRVVIIGLISIMSIFLMDSFTGTEINFGSLLEKLSFG